METKEIIVAAHLHSYWHIGSGFGSGLDKDNLVVTRPNGLPFIPGKVIKGLLRDSAYLLHQIDKEHVSQDFINSIFGIGEDDAEQKGLNVERDKDIDNCFFSNLILPSNKDMLLHKHHLFHQKTTTAIDHQTGVAKSQSLRTIQVVLPMKLYGSITHFPFTKNNFEQLEKVAKFTRHLGLNRNRGLGRCQISVSQKSPSNA